MTEKEIKQPNCSDCFFSQNCYLYQGIVGIIPQEVYLEFLEKQIGKRCNEYENSNKT